MPALNSTINLGGVCDFRSKICLFRSEWRIEVCAYARETMRWPLRRILRWSRLRIKLYVRMTERSPTSRLPVRRDRETPVGVVHSKLHMRRLRLLKQTEKFS